MFLLDRAEVHLAVAVLIERYEEKPSPFHSLTRHHNYSDEHGAAVVLFAMRGVVGNVGWC